MEHLGRAKSTATVGRQVVIIVPVVTTEPVQPGTGIADTDSHTPGEFVIIAPSRPWPGTRLAVIRFNCPNCGREYEVPAALALLPLLCKKCGERIPVPAAPTAPEPRAAPPPPRPAITPAPPPAPPKAPPPPPAATAPPVPAPKPAEAAEEPLFVTTNLEALTAPPLRPPKPAHPRPAPPAPEAPPRKPGKLLGVVVDVVAVLVLLAAGSLLGEMLAGKATREVWNDAGSSVTFPPTDLLMWLAPPVLLALVYALLISRGKSLGARLRVRG